VGSFVVLVVISLADRITGSMNPAAAGRSDGALRVGMNFCSGCGLIFCTMAGATALTKGNSGHSTQRV